MCSGVQLVQVLAGSLACPGVGWCTWDGPGWEGGSALLCPLAGVPRPDLTGWQRHGKEAALMHELLETTARSVSAHIPLIQGGSG